MKKKLLVTTLSVMLALGVASCSKDSDPDPSIATVSLNTNADDIRALDFYNAAPTEEDYLKNPIDEILKVTEFTQLDAPVAGDVIAIVETSLGTIKIKLLPEVAPKAVHNFVELSLSDYYDGLTFHRVIDEFMAQTGDPEGTGMGGTSTWGVPFVNEISTYARHFPGALAMANSANNYSNGSQFYLVDYFTLPQSMLDEFTMYSENQDVPIDSLYNLEAPEDSELADGESSTEEITSPLVSEIFPQQIIDAFTELGGAPYLDFGYTVFGQTFEGMDVIDAITQVAVDEASSKPVEDVIIKDITIGIME